jgi:hypothetical protein
MAFPALPACLYPGWWASHRTPFLAAARLLVTLLYAAQLLAAAPAALSPVGLAEALLVHSGAAALCFMPFRWAACLPAAGQSGLRMPAHC